VATTEQNPVRLHQQGVVRASRGGESVRFEADDRDGFLGVLRGRFASFGEWTEINNKLEGHFMEQISERALSKSVAESRDRIRVLFHHGLDPSIGMKVLGPIRALEPDSSYEVDLIDTDYNRNLLPGLQAGLYGASFRFDAVKHEPNYPRERSDHNPSMLPESVVTEARVKEFGPTPFPAYAGASASVTMRSLTDEIALAELLGSPSMFEPESLRVMLEAVALRADQEPSDDTPEPASRDTQQEVSTTQAEEQPLWMLQP